MSEVKGFEAIWSLNNPKLREVYFGLSERISKIFRSKRNINLLDIAGIEECNEGRHREIEKKNSEILWSLFNHQDKNGEFSFLFMFLNTFFPEAHVFNNPPDTIDKEKYIPLNNKRMDLFIEKKGEYAVVIENKITEYGFQPNQIKNYIDGIHSFGFDYQQIYVIIMVGTNKEFKKKNNFKKCQEKSTSFTIKTITYDEGILKFLKDILDKPIVKEDCNLYCAIKQYIFYLQDKYNKFTMDKETIRDMIDVLKIDNTPFAVYSQIDKMKNKKEEVDDALKALNSLAIEVAKEFFVTMKTELEMKTDKKLYDTETEGEPGIYHRITKDTSPIDIIIAYENENGLFYGLKIPDNIEDSIVTDNNYKDAKEKLSDLCKRELPRKNNDNKWFGWNTIAPECIEKLGEKYINLIDSVYKILEI